MNVRKKRLKQIVKCKCRHCGGHTFKLLMVLHFQPGLKGIHKLLENTHSKTMANMNIVSSAANIEMRKQNDVYKEKEEERKGKGREGGKRWERSTESKSTWIKSI